MPDMDVQFEWNPKNFENNIKKANKITKETMKDALQKSIDITSEKAKKILGERKKTVGNKNLIASLEKASKYSVNKVLSAEKAQAGTKYPGANLIENGTKPHAVGWNPIEEWISTNSSVLGVGDVGRATHYMREHIERKGTASIKYMQTGIKNSEQDIQKALDEAAEKLLKRVGF